MASDRQPDRPAPASERPPIAPDVFQTFAERDLEGAPLVPAEAREDLLALKAGATFVCARPDGDIRAARASGEGYYARDTRHLSELRLTVGGLAPVLLSSSMQSGHHAVINATNSTLRLGEVEVPQETLNVRRTVLIADRLYYRVRVRSFCPEIVATTVELTLGADFADVFEVRGRAGAVRMVASLRPCETAIVCGSLTRVPTASSVRRSSTSVLLPRGSRPIGSARGSPGMCSLTRGRPLRFW